MNLAAFNGPHSSAVGTHDGQIFQFSVGNCLSDSSADAGGLQTGDSAVFDIGDDGIIGLSQGAGTDGDILHAHPVHFLHDHIDHVISLPEMVVEG